MAKNTPKVRLPGQTDRITIIGPTGSGKTHAALWHLSNAPFDVMPWVLIDPKRETLISQIEGADYIDFASVPDKPGIYIIQPLPSDADVLNQYLLAIWEKENTGVWIDEGLMFGVGDGIDALFTQGRSKHIPVIMLAQRPVWLSRFAISEASFIQYFRLKDERDRRTVGAFSSIPVDERLPKFHSYYYDMSQDISFHFAPMPKSDQILSRINTRMDAIKPRKKYTFM